jgi:hypothetical protein
MKFGFWLTELVSHIGWQRTMYVEQTAEHALLAQRQVENDYPGWVIVYWTSLFSV